MRLTAHGRSFARRGTILPMLAMCLVALFGFVALAVDLGMLAVSRTQCQNAADVAALTGCRQLNNKPGATNSNLAQAVATARSSILNNPHLSTNFTTAQIQRIEVGQYLYNPLSETFAVTNWANVTNNTAVSPPGGSWTALRATVSVSQPTYFMRVFGVTSMPTGAVATAVYKPRDIAFAIDMTASMAFSSQFNFGGRSLNPDNLIPSFGHYISTQSNLRATQNQANGSGEALSRNNYTIATPNGPPIVRNFYYDPANTANPANPVVTVNVNNLRNAFHCIPAGSETPGNESTYTPPTYNFSAYNAFDTTRTFGPTPAPAWFGTMTDSGSVPYVGDRWRRADGSINKTNTSWNTGSASTRQATTAIELLGYNVSNGNVRGGTSGTTVITSEDRFRDPIWEAHGYDLDIVRYRADKGNGPPRHPSNYTAPLVPPADRYLGYSMGPGYWGKTFFIWPPDPRFDPAANLTSPDPNRPAFDTSGRPMCDWRRRFFFRVVGSNSALFDPQADNLDTNSGTNSFDGINEVLFRNGSGMTLNSTIRVNYAAVLRWLKTGPQTLPPNLRAGRILYYSSIPDDVDTNTGTDQQRRDKAFWKNYIDFVLGVGNYTGSNNLYGNADSWSAAALNLFQNDLKTWTGPSGTWAAQRPYMRYNDSPNRPRLHFWFGPLSMLDFMGKAGVGNMLPGTCNEAQCWQLKAGMNSVLDDVRNNHPNDYVGLVYFAANHHNGIRVPMGQNFTALKNALFYPRSLLSAINSGDTTSEIRPYTTNGTTLGWIDAAEIPNARGSTDPNTGLFYAFNLLSPSALLPPQYTTIVNGQPVRGRRGATKIVVFETDGVPNTYRGISSSVTTMNPILKGFDTYYPPSGWSSGNVGNGNATSISEAIKIAKQIVKPMATTNADGTDSGLSLPNAPARVYAVAFGDLFDAALAPNATFRPTAQKFLADLAAAGGTGPAGATTLPDHLVITGTYQQRIDKLKICMERIFQSGVAVTLIE